MPPIFQSKTSGIIHKPTSVLPILQGIRHKTAFLGLFGFFCFVLFLVCCGFFVTVFVQLLQYLRIVEFSGLKCESLCYTDLYGIFPLSQAIFSVCLKVYFCRTYNPLPLPVWWQLKTDDGLIYFSIGQWLLLKSNEALVVCPHPYPSPTILIPFPQCCPSFMAVSTWGC